MASPASALCCSVPLDRVQSVLGSSRKLPCLYCDRTFASANLRQKHVERGHGARKGRRKSRPAPQCPHCDRLSGDHDLGDLFRHLSVEHPLEYFGCVPCEERFVSASLLAEHRMGVHKSLVEDERIKSGSDIVEDTSSSLNVQSSVGSSSNTTQNQTNKKKIIVKSSKLALKRSKRLEAQAKEKESQKKVKKRSKPPEKKLNSNANTSSSSSSENSTKLNDKSKSCVNPYPEFDSFYRVKKITDHSIDNLKISSLTFDDVFDKAFFTRMKCNIEENLSHHIDGKLFKNEESESRISNFEIISNCSQGLPNQNLENFGCEVSLNAVTPVTSISLNTQIGEDFESQIEYGSRASNKKKTPIKKDEVHYKYFTRRKYQASILQHKENRDLSRLDMWTQLVIKERQQKMIDDQKTPKELLEYTSCEEYKNKIKREELNRILDKRGPFEDLREEATKKAAFEKLNSSSDISQETFMEVRDIVTEILNKVCAEFELPEVKEIVSLRSVFDDNSERQIPTYLNLRRTSSLPVEGEMDKSDRITLICSSQETEDFVLPVRAKDELVELTGEWARCRMYVCAACGAKLPNMRYLLEHKSAYHANVWAQHYEFVGTQSELYRHLAIPGLGKVGAVEAAAPCKSWRRSEARLCTKCAKQCNSLGELHRHVLECGGDWTWMLARRKCKYRPFGAKSRRKRRGKILGLVNRIHHKQKSPDSPEKKTQKKPLDGPRPKPSDAETIQRMLANLPAKRRRRTIVSLQDAMYKTKKTKSGSGSQNKNKDSSSGGSSRKAMRSLNKVLSSRILDTNGALIVKRKLKKIGVSSVNCKTHANEDIGNNILKIPQIQKNNRSKIDVEEGNNKRVSPRNSSGTVVKNKMSVKKMLSSKLNIKNFFPVKKKKNSTDESSNERRTRSTTTGSTNNTNSENNTESVPSNKKMGIKNLVRTLSGRSNKNKDKIKITNNNKQTIDKNEEAIKLTKKRKLQNSFKTVIDKVKKLKIDSSQPQDITKNNDLKAQTNIFLEKEIKDKIKIITPLKLNQDSVSLPVLTVNNFLDNINENLPIPETIFNLETSNEKSLQAKGELDFDKRSDEKIILKPESNVLSIDTSNNEKSKSPMVSPNINKGKIRKPNRGLNDCIAMLTSKLQQKDKVPEKIDEIQKIEISTPSCSSKPTFLKNDYILKVPTFKVTTQNNISETALDLSKKNMPQLPQISISTPDLSHNAAQNMPNITNNNNNVLNSTINTVIGNVIENKCKEVFTESLCNKWGSVDTLVQNQNQILMNLRKSNSVDETIEFVVNNYKPDKDIIEKPLDKNIPLNLGFRFPENLSVFQIPTQNPILGNFGSNPISLDILKSISDENYIRNTIENAKKINRSHKKSCSKKKLPTAIVAPNLIQRTEEITEKKVPEIEKNVDLKPKRIGRKKSTSGVQNVASKIRIDPNLRMSESDCDEKVLDEANTKIEIISDVIVPHEEKEEKIVTRKSPRKLRKTKSTLPVVETHLDDVLNVQEIPSNKLENVVENTNNVNNKLINEDESILLENKVVEILKNPSDSEDEIPLADLIKSDDIVENIEPKVDDKILENNIETTQNEERIVPTEIQDPEVKNNEIISEPEPIVENTDNIDNNKTKLDTPKNNIISENNTISEINVIPEISTIPEIDTTPEIDTIPEINTIPENNTIPEISDEVPKIPPKSSKKKRKSKKSNKANTKSVEKNIEPILSEISQVQENLKHLSDNIELLESSNIQNEKEIITEIAQDESQIENNENENTQADVAMLDSDQQKILELLEDKKEEILFKETQIDEEPIKPEINEQTDDEKITEILNQISQEIQYESFPQLSSDSLEEQEICNEVKSILPTPNKKNKKSNKKSAKNNVKIKKTEVEEQNANIPNGNVYERKPRAAKEKAKNLIAKSEKVVDNIEAESINKTTKNNYENTIEDLVAILTSDKTEETLLVENEKVVENKVPEAEICDELKQIENELVEIVSNKIEQQSEAINDNNFTVNMPIVEELSQDSSITQECIPFNLNDTDNPLYEKLYNTAVLLDKLETDDVNSTTKTPKKPKKNNVKTNSKIKKKIVVEESGTPHRLTRSKSASNIPIIEEKVELVAENNSLPFISSKNLTNDDENVEMLPTLEHFTTHDNIDKSTDINIDINNDNQPPVLTIEQSEVKEVSKTLKKNRRGNKKKKREETIIVQNEIVKENLNNTEDNNISIIQSEDKVQNEEQPIKIIINKHRARRKSKSFRKIEKTDDNLFEDFALVINKKTKRIPPTSIVDDSVCEEIDNLFQLPQEMPKNSKVESENNTKCLDDSVEEMDMEIDEIPVNSSIIERSNTENIYEDLKSEILIDNLEESAKIVENNIEESDININVCNNENIQATLPLPLPTENLLVAKIEDNIELASDIPNIIEKLDENINSDELILPPIEETIIRNNVNEEHTEIIVENEIQPKKNASKPKKQPKSSQKSKKSSNKPIEILNNTITELPQEENIIKTDKINGTLEISHENSEINLVKEIVEIADKINLTTEMANEIIEKNALENLENDKIVPNLNFPIKQPESITSLEESLGNVIESIVKNKNSKIKANILPDIEPLSQIITSSDMDIAPVIDEIDKSLEIDEIYGFNDEFNDNFESCSKKQNESVSRRKSTRNAKAKALENIHEEALAELTENDQNKKVVVSSDILVPDVQPNKKKGGKKSKKKQEIITETNVTEVNVVNSDVIPEENIEKTKENVIPQHINDIIDANVEIFQESCELRRSNRRNSKKVASYNENDLIDPLIDALENRRKNLKKDNKAQNENKETEKKLNSEELFDLLKASTVENNVVIAKNNNTNNNASFLNNIEESSSTQDFTDDNFENVFENILEKSTLLIRTSHLDKKKDIDKIYEFTESSPESSGISKEPELKFNNKKSTLSNTESSIDNSLSLPHTPDLKYEQKSNKTSDDIEKTNYCEICNKSFSRLENLIKHKRTLTHISKLSELEAKEAEEKAKQQQIISEKSKVHEDINISDILQKSDQICSENTPKNVEIQSPRFANNDTLKLADIINDVLNKPVSNEIEDKNSRFSSGSTTSSDSEFRRYKSLGERKSFESEKLPLNNAHTTFAEKQISLLENIISDKNQYNLDEISNEATFVKPLQYDEVSCDSNNKNITPHFDDTKTRKTLNRDEELFIECCSLLKSSSEVSNYSKKSKIPCENEPEQMETKNLPLAVASENAQEFCDNSRTPTPLGDTFDDNASGSNTISSNWNMRNEGDGSLGHNQSFTFEEVLHGDVEECENAEKKLSKFNVIAKSVKKQLSSVSNLLSRKPATTPSPDPDHPDNKKIITKGARKVFEGLKVSIPTEELDLDGVLNCSPKTKSDTFQEPGRPVRSSRKSKPVKKSTQVAANILFKVNKKKGTAKSDSVKSDAGISDPVISDAGISDAVISDAKSDAVIRDDVTSEVVKSDITKGESSSYGAIDNDDLGNERNLKDVYDFEENTQDNLEVFAKPNYKAFRSWKNNEIDVGNDVEDEEGKEKNITKKKCKIMGRIFKNQAKNKVDEVDEEIRAIPEIDNNEFVENYVKNCSQMSEEESSTPKNSIEDDKQHKLTEKELDNLFDKLLENSPQDKADKETNVVNKQQSKTKINENNKKKQPKVKNNRKRPRGNSESSDDEFNINKNSKKRNNRKNPKEEDNIINLEQELRECIGVASRKSQRKCTSGKQNILVEYWSSDEEAFEALLETQKIQQKEPKLTQNITEKQPEVTENVEKTIEKEKTLVQNNVKPKNMPDKKVKKKPPLDKKQSSEKDKSSSKSSENPSVSLNRRKRAAVNPLYHWSSSSEDESQNLIEVKPIREEIDDDEDRPIQHGWIVGDSPKKLVTMLALTKGKKTDIECVKEQKKRTSAVS